MRISSLMRFLIAGLLTVAVVATTSVAADEADRDRERAVRERQERAAVEAAEAAKRQAHLAAEMAKRLAMDRQGRPPGAVVVPAAQDDAAAAKEAAALAAALAQLPPPPDDVLVRTVVIGKVLSTRPAPQPLYGADVTLATVRVLETFGGLDDTGAEIEVMCDGKIESGSQILMIGRDPLRPWGKLLSAETPSRQRVEEIGKQEESDRSDKLPPGLWVHTRDVGATQAIEDFFLTPAGDFRFTRRVAQSGWEDQTHATDGTLTDEQRATLLAAAEAVDSHAVGAGVPAGADSRFTSIRWSDEAGGGQHTVIRYPRQGTPPEVIRLISTFVGEGRGPATQPTTRATIWPAAAR